MRSEAHFLTIYNQPSQPGSYSGTMSTMSSGAYGIPQGLGLNQQTPETHGYCVLKFDRIIEAEVEGIKAIFKNGEISDKIDDPSATVLYHIRFSIIVRGWNSSVSLVVFSDGEDKFQVEPVDVTVYVSGSQRKLLSLNLTQRHKNFIRRVIKCYTTRITKG
jgi:hypothetical protein